MAPNRDSPLKRTTRSSSSALKNAFSQIIKGKEPTEIPVLRNTYSRPIPSYNDYYDPYRAPLAQKPSKYTPYQPRQPL